MSRDDALRRKEFGAFVRSRRERISPERVGLPDGGRRRTPGLRREEVALLAGVGVTWYTWLEQGRDINVSVQVVDAVARALMLDAHERAHLLALSGAEVGPPQTECRSLTAGARAMLAKLEPYPACVVNARTDILAFNRTYGRLIADLAALPVQDRNSTWLMFTNPAWRASFPDWEEAAEVSVGWFRSAMARHVGEPGWKDLVARLRHASPEFDALWQRRGVVPARNHSKTIVNKDVGRLDLDYTFLWLSDNGGPRLMFYTPMNEETSDRLERLAALVST